MTKRYLIEFILTVTEKFTAEVDVPDHIADDDLRQYLQDQVDDGESRAKMKEPGLLGYEVLTSCLTSHEEIKE